MADTTTTSPDENYLMKVKGYVRTQKGLILAAEIFISLIILICYAASYFGGYFVLALSEMIISTAFFVIFMMELDKQVLVVNWIWTDLFRAGLAACLYLITSLIAVIGGSGDGARITGGVFGLIAGLLFAYDTYTIYLQAKTTRQQTAAPGDARV
ncbi:proteolipid protein 2b [Betta splendens]|uniref:Proteolipid protein 2 n=1 Tax=Betta splendens TaxID=158456 RepID=A0A6P7MXH6_BETSP|nr:proteolipid protein 2b [Betta splendens]